MNGKQLIMLAADFVAGGITADMIKDEYGDGVLSSVLAIAGGSIAGVVTNSVLEAVDRETGIISDVGSVVDDVIDTFKFW